MLRQFLEWIRSGERSAAELVALCLERIRDREPELHAWVEVAPQEALGDGPLRGIPFGAKDIFETRGLATEYGSPLYAGRKGECDAALVRQLRERGAILLGKTQTTAFAYFDPAPTRNPRNPAHTPGGSSSGSAAAVAAGMVPVALGSQTQGSILRPASYCGVTGFKPTYGVLPLDGVLPFAPSLDTAGFFTQTAADMVELWRGLGFAAEDGGGARIGVPAQDVMPPAFQDSMERLRAAGWRIETIDLPASFGALLTAARLVNHYEGARTHEQRWRAHGERIGRKLAQLVAEGLSIADAEYQAALAAIEQARREMLSVIQEVSIMATPAATGPAPPGLASTGDPRRNAPWTALHTPAVSIPMPVGDALPLGLQLTAGWDRDGALLVAAARAEMCLR